MNTTTEITVPAEFVRAFTADKYRKEIVTWHTSSAPSDLVMVLRNLKAPRAAFVEIGVALAEGVLPKYESRYPADLRPRKTIDAAKAWLRDGSTANAQVADRETQTFYIITKVADAISSNNATISANNAAYAAACAAWVVTAALSNVSVVMAVTYAMNAGLSHQCVIDIIKEVGQRYFAFLKQA
jgi:hypothetical protein